MKKNPLHNMDFAGDNVGIKLTEPLDCSQMDIQEIRFVPKVRYDNTMQYIRTSVLRAWIKNDDGDEELLTITFELESYKRPKIPKPIERGAGDDYPIIPQ